MINETDVKLKKICLFQCLLEVVNILDMICKIEPGKVAGVFQEIRRLYNKLMQELDKPRLLVPILQFFLNHGMAIACLLLIKQCMLVHE